MKVDCDLPNNCSKLDVFLTPDVLAIMVNRTTMICLERVSFKYLYSVSCMRLRAVGEYLIEDVGRKMRLIALD